MRKETIISLLKKEGFDVIKNAKYYTTMKKNNIIVDIYKDAEIWWIDFYDLDDNVANKRLKKVFKKLRKKLKSNYSISLNGKVIYEDIDEVEDIWDDALYDKVEKVQIK